MKKTKKHIFLIIIAGLMVVAATGFYYLRNRPQTDQESQEIVELEEGQYIKYARIDSIAGNELSYTVMEEQKNDAATSHGGQQKQKSDNTQSEQSGQMPERMRGSGTGQRPDNAQSEQSGQMPDSPRGSGTGQRPDDAQSEQSGQMPDSPRGSGTGQRPDNAQSEQSGNRSQKSQENQTESIVSYVETKEKGQLQIPVGTEVITKLGTSTTFSRLSNGDLIAMVLQQDDSGNEVVMKIRIVG